MDRKILSPISIFIFLFYCSACIFAVDVYVSVKGNDVMADGSAEFPFYTLQRAIDLSFSGDIVQIMPGVYRGTGNVDLVLRGKNLTIQSTDGVDSVIVDCEQLHRALILEKGDSLVAIGITFRNGFADTGGSIIVSEASPSFINCSFQANRATTTGGAISASFAANPVFVNCSFVKNTALGGGAVVASVTAQPLFQWCLFDSNSAGTGGGINAADSSLVSVEDSVFARNSATKGGALAVRNSATVQVRYTSVENNEAFNGAGVHVGDSAKISMKSSIVKNNTATVGGFLYTDMYATADLDEVSIWFNAASRGGGAIYLATAASIPTIHNSSFAFNTAELEGLVYPYSMALAIQQPSNNNSICSNRGSWLTNPVMNCNCPSSTERGQLLDCDRNCPGNPSCSGNGRCTAVPSETQVRCEYRSYRSVCVNEIQPICNCYFGYSGKNCSIACPGINSTAKTVCSGHGHCLRAQSDSSVECVCAFGFSHTDCSRIRLYVLAGKTLLLSGNGNNNNNITNNGTNVGNNNTGVVNASMLGGNNSLGNFTNNNNSTNSSTTINLAMVPTNRVVRLGDKIISNNDLEGLQLLAFNLSDPDLPLIVDETFETRIFVNEGQFFNNDGVVNDNNGDINVNASIAPQTDYNAAAPGGFRMFFREEEANRMAKLIQDMGNSHLVVITSHGDWLNQTNRELALEMIKLGAPDLTPYVNNKQGSGWSLAVIGCKTADTSRFSKLVDVSSYAEIEVNMSWNSTINRWELFNRTANRLEAWDLATDLDPVRTMRWNHGSCKKGNLVALLPAGDPQQLLCLNGETSAPAGTSVYGGGEPVARDLALYPSFDYRRVIS